VPEHDEWLQPVPGHGCGNAANESGEGAAGGNGSVELRSAKACFWPLQSHSSLAHWPLAHFPFAHCPLAQGVTAVALAATVCVFSLQQVPSQHSVHGTAGGAAGGSAFIRSRATRHGTMAATSATATVDFMFDLLHEGGGRKSGES
jgi:hypothetical protein